MSPLQHRPFHMITALCVLSQEGTKSDELGEAFLLLDVVDEVVGCASSPEVVPCGVAYVALTEVRDYRGLLLLRPQL